MSQQIIIDYWVEKAGEDLASARDNLKSETCGTPFRFTDLKL